MIDKDNKVKIKRELNDKLNKINRDKDKRELNDKVDDRKKNEKLTRSPADPILVNDPLPGT